MSSTVESYWLFTAPHEPVWVRRGDPLGFRLAADYFADLLVPDLSNRSVDARWLTLLSWALSNAVQGWRHYDDRDMAVMPARDRQAARRLYEWVRPLELLWVARTLTLTSEDSRGRQLPGQRAVRRWLMDRSEADFGLSAEQRVRYRQTGAYGGYRVALRRLPGLTTGGDGWRPGEVGKKLAEIVRVKIGWKVPRFDRAKRRSVKGSDYWLQYWQKWDSRRGGDFLPERSDRVRRLPSSEARALRQVLFGGGKAGTPEQQANQHRRAQVAQILGRSKARTHAQLCEEILKGLKSFPDGRRRKLSSLSSFTSLADAGTDAMDSVWRALGDDLSVPMRDLMRDESIREALDELKKQAFDFRVADGEDTPGIAVAVRFARSLRRAGRPVEVLSTLVEHHQMSGGGMRWFVADGGQLTRNAPANRGGRVSFYRFRLRGLARLAVQCGQIDRMPPALMEADDEENAGGDEE